MIRGGNIATQVLFQGGLEFNPNTLMFSAVKKDKSMEKVTGLRLLLKRNLVINLEPISSMDTERPSGPAALRMRSSLARKHLTFLTRL
jgi:hypothetical protein